MSEIERVTCPFCSLHCTDLQLTFDGGRLAGFSPACPLGGAGFNRAAASLSDEQPASASFESSLRKARTWLQEARQVLVVLSGDLDDEAIPAAVRLARKYTAILTCDEDSTGAVLGLSMKTAGSLSASMHEIREMSLVVLCGVDPTSTHPRLKELLDCNLATDCVHLNPPDALEALRWLRLALSDPPLNIPDPFSEVASQMGAATSGVVVFGPEWLKASLPLTTELLLWLKTLNQEKHWYGLYLAPAANSTGVVEMLLSETGHPGNLRFNQERIDFSPALWRAERIIQNGDADVCLLAGRPASFSEKTLERCSHVRTILIDPDPPTWTTSAWLPCARAGVDVPGRFQRLDGVQVNLQAILPSMRRPMKDMLIELTQEESAA